MSNSTFGSLAPLYSITNADVAESDRLDAQNPFDFYSFLKYSRDTLSPLQFNDAYQKYLVLWGQAKSYTTQQADNLVRDRYVELLKDITLNYLTYEERRFITAAKRDGLGDSSDVDIIIPFYSRKLREICTFYANKREQLKQSVQANKERGNASSVERSIFETLTDYVTVADDDALISNVPSIQLESILNNLNIEIEELYDLYSSYLDNSPNLTYQDYNVQTSLRQELYTSNINDIEADLFLNFDEAVKKYIFDNVNLYLDTLGTNFKVNYNIDAVNLDCKPDDNLYNIITSNKDAASAILSLKKKLIQKYIGADFYYIKTGTTLTDVTSGVLFAADNPTGNLLNRHFPTTASVEETSVLTSMRRIGLFFRPEKNGILYFSAPKSRYKIDTNKLLPNKVYIFPDPSIYGNTTGLTNDVDSTYPLIHIQDYTSVIKNAGDFHTEGDTAVDHYRQTFHGYFSRNQISHGLLTNKEGLSTNLSVVANQGKLTQWSTDIYGNQWGLFNPSSLKLHVDATTPDSNPSLTAYEMYDGGPMSFYINGELPEAISSDNPTWVYPNIYSSDYYYNALFDGGLSAISNGIMIRAGLTQGTLSSTANLTLNYVASSIQYKVVDGGYISDANHANFAHDNGKNFFINEVVGENTTQFDISNNISTQYGVIYIRDAATGKTNHLSAAFSSIFDRYPATIAAEILSAVADFNVYNDILYIRTKNYFIATKVGYDGIIINESSTASYISCSANTLENISDPFFSETGDHALMCAVSSVSSTHNASALVPVMYKLHYDTGRITPIPIQYQGVQMTGGLITSIALELIYDGLSFTTAADYPYDVVLNYNNIHFSNGTMILDGGLFTKTTFINALAVLSAFQNPLPFKVSRIETPILVYNSRNDLHTMLVTVYDSNDFAYIYQMYLKYDQHVMNLQSIRMISMLMQGDAHTVNWMDTGSVTDLYLNNIMATVSSYDATEGALVLYGS